MSDRAAYRAWCEWLYGVGCWVPTGGQLVVPAARTDPHAFEMWWVDREHDPGDEDRSER